MNYILESIVCRYMKDTTPGLFTRGADPSPPTAIPLARDEELLGWYRNPLPIGGYLILFTTRNLYIDDHGTHTRVPIDQMTGYEHPRSNAIDGVTVKTPTGDVFFRVAGRYGEGDRYRDAFSFLMVIRALTEGKPVRLGDIGE